MSDRLIRFPGNSWQEIEALPGSPRPFPQDDPLPGVYQLHLPSGG